MDTTRFDKQMKEGLERGRAQSKALDQAHDSLVSAAAALRSLDGKSDPKTIEAALLESQRAAKNIEEYIKIHRDGKLANFIMVVK